MADIIDGSPPEDISSDRAPWQIGDNMDELFDDRDRESQKEHASYAEQGDQAPRQMSENMDELPLGTEAQGQHVNHVGRGHRHTNTSDQQYSPRYDASPRDMTCTVDGKPVEPTQITRCKGLSISSDAGNRLGQRKGPYLKRPDSSQEDPAAGFAFATKSATVLNFNRKREQVPADVVIDQKASSLQQPLPLRSAPHRANSMLPKTTEAGDISQSTPTMKPNQNLKATVKNPIQVPFPNAGIGARQQLSLPASASNAKLMHAGPYEDPAPPLKPIHEAGILVASGFGDLSLSGLSNQHVQSNATPKPVLGPSALPNTPVKITNPEKQRKRVGNKRQISKDPRFEATNVGRPNYAELLSKLEENDIQRQKILEEQKTELQLKDDDISCLMNFTNDLQASLEDAEAECDQTKAKFAEMKACQPKWEQSIKKIHEYVSGLCTDHNALRDEASDIRETRIDVDKDKAQLLDDIKDIRQIQVSLDQQVTNNKRVGSEGLQHINLLDETIQHLQSQLQDEKNLIGLERDRNQRLEEELSAMKSNHVEMISMFKTFDEKVDQKMEDILNKPGVTNVVSPLARPDDNVTPLLNQCIGLLQELGNKKVVQPEDLQKLDGTVKGYSESMMQSVQKYEKLATDLATAQQTMGASTKDQLRALGDNMVCTDDFRQQVMGLREDKAILKEKLYSSINDLTWQRQEVASLRRKEEETVRTITKLEVDLDAARNQPRNSPLMESRLRELKADRMDLQQRIQNIQDEAATHSTQIQDKSGEIDHLQKQLREANEKTEAARAERKTWETVLVEKHEQNVKDSLEQQRKDLTDIAKRRENTLRGDYENHEMRTKRENDEKCKDLEYQWKTAERRLDIEIKDSEEKQSELVADLQGQLLESRRLLNQEQATVQRLKDLNQQKGLENLQEIQNLKDRVRELHKIKNHPVGQPLQIEQKLHPFYTVKNPAQNRHASFANGVGPPGPPLPVKSKHFGPVVEDSQAKDTVIHIPDEDVEDIQEDESQSQDVDAFKSLFDFTPGRNVEHAATKTTMTHTHTMSYQSEKTAEQTQKSQAQPLGVMTGSQTPHVDPSKRIGSTNDKDPSRMPRKLWQEDKARRQQSKLADESPQPARMPHELRTGSRASQSTQDSLRQQERAASTVEPTYPRPGPRSILKDTRGPSTTTANIGSQKRSATAGNNATEARGAPNKKLKPSFKDLGPIIGDSQSPGGSQFMPGRVRKQSTKAGYKSSKDKEYIDFFLQVQATA